MSPASMSAFAIAATSPLCVVGHLACTAVRTGLSPVAPSRGCRDPAHPGIAQVYSAGVENHEGKGIPFFAMEYIADAMELTDWADDQSLSERQRLQLFRTVCEAVAHGHQRGVMHLDLKPGNILVSAEGQEDFDGLRGYQPSDSLRTVDWKAYARSNTLYTKQFHGYQSTTRWLRWADVPGADLELRLSHLCYWVLELSREGEPYGLDLPGRTISPALGKSHEEACLVALAEFGHG